MDNSTVMARLERLERRADGARRRLFLAFVAGTIIAFGPAVAVANHIFSDVPTSHPFHNDIERVYDARITAGCSATTYCPETNVTRGQMAAFLSRTGGRVDYDDGVVDGVTTQTILATVTIRPGNVPGGTAFVKLDASAYAYTNSLNETGCVPCQVGIWIDRQDNDDQSHYSLFQLHNLSTAVGEVGSGSLTFVVQVATGADVTFDLYVARQAGSGSITAVGSIAATYYPFGAVGTDTLVP
jgi:hypothetical protein